MLTRADATALYGASEPDWAALGYHDATRVDGAPAIAVNHTRYDYSPQGMISRRIDALGPRPVSTTTPTACSSCA